MQSDTLIGIAGAVVLVAVMVGVFAYEYNNAPIDDDGDGGGNGDQQERMEQFNATYPTLDPLDDIDGDGTPNWQDDDLDGDGTPNAEDDTIEVTFAIEGAAPAHTNPTGTGSPTGIGEFRIGKGATTYRLDVSHNTGTVGTFRAQVSAGDAGTCTTGQEGTCTITPTGDTGEGSVYAVEARQTAVNPNALTVTVTAVVTYA